MQAKLVYLMLYRGFLPQSCDLQREALSTGGPNPIDELPPNFHIKLCLRPDHLPPLYICPRNARGDHDHSGYRLAGIST